MLAAACGSHIQNHHHLFHSQLLSCLACGFTSQGLRLGRASLIPKLPRTQWSPAFIWYATCLSQFTNWHPGFPRAGMGMLKRLHHQEPHLLPSARGDYYTIREKSQIIQRSPHWVSHCGQHGQPGLWDMLGAQGPSQGKITADKRPPLLSVGPATQRHIRAVLQANLCTDSESHATPLASWLQNP